MVIIGLPAWCRDKGGMEGDGGEWRVGTRGWGRMV
jgi:hypothetical protein